ncbi:LuxR C-terminal-related transcriptional regulator [Variovorax terrae]|uniref:Response regulator transcription factor n=1 Tax=Variovorax terrae TaxID=2923278 RepID=A0A9X2AM92_9BURK|nr:response regulator transcription factor [Variovorax terrae]
MRVILVDADPCMRRTIIQELLADHRIRVVGEADSLATGRRLVTQADFDVLILDVRLGDGYGLELIKAAKKHRGTIEVIVLSALDDESQILQAFESGASGYLVKNSWFRDMAQSVLQVVNGGAAISPDLARRVLLKRLSEDLPKAAPAYDPIEDVLSARERQVLKLVAAGQVNQDIASTLSISNETVSAHIKSIFRKLNVHTRAQAVNFVARQNLH